MKIKSAKIYLELLLVYLVIFFQYPLGLAIGKFVLNQNLFYEIQPNHLLLWGIFRLLVVLPLIFFLMSKYDRDSESIYLHLGEKNKMLSLTFWGTLIFTFLSLLIYPFFINQTGLSISKFMILFPIFSMFAISNAFVEEVYFRGVSLTFLTEKTNFFIANLVQSVFFAAIHFINPMSSSLLLFVLLTFVLGLVWGWLTKRTQSLIPAIVLHIIADVFVAISLF